MRYFLLTALAASTAVTLTFAGAQAADILSQEDRAHTLTITTSSGKKTVEIAAKGDIRNVCDGCTIALEDGQMVEPKASDIVFLIDGKLSIYED